jgi:H+/Cl- antiporter ClcA
MFSNENIIVHDHWNDPSVSLNLFIYSVLKFFLTVLAISCPIPNGVFTPSFVLGAAFGRLYGYVLS